MAGNGPRSQRRAGKGRPVTRLSLNHICRIGAMASVLCFTGQHTAFAQSQKTDVRPHANRIMGDALKAEYSGVTHKGAYNFTQDGDPRQFYTETTRADGTAAYSELNIQSGGTWSVNNDTLCFQYKNQDMTGGCFRVYRVGNCYYYYSDTVLLRRDELDRDYWTARSVKRGETPNCEPGVS